MRYAHSATWAGYAIMATSLDGRSCCSYTEANSPAQAIERCKVQFPPERGWHTFGCREILTRVETWEKSALSLDELDDESCKRAISFNNLPRNDLGLNYIQQSEWNRILHNADDYGGKEGVRRILERSRLTREQKDTLLSRLTPDELDSKSCKRTALSLD